MHRRTLLTAALAGLVGTRLPALVRAAHAQDAPAPFGFDAVVAEARAAAAEPYARPLMKMAPPFADLRYDAFRAIRFREDRRLFADGTRAFQMELLPPGHHFQDRIGIDLVAADGRVQPVAFSTDYFDFHPDYFPFPDGRAPAGIAADMAFSGLRFRSPINRPGVWDEVAVFQGASYFRAVAHDTLFGLSARGLAIGTAGPEPEEFPIFKHFWVHEPRPGDRALRLQALLDSESVAGAFDVLLEPGTVTALTVEAVLFPRREIATVGIAPLTSMYYFGPENRADVDDFRDAVHDSDGLRIVNGSGERLWRPLRNPPRVETSAFRDDNPRAFGLIQRARTFEHYSDAEVHYERRPSAWVEPIGAWGAGAVMLAEIPSADEFTDNIVAFWRPAAPLAEGSEARFAYRLSFGTTQPEDLPLARVVGTRSGLSILDGRERVFVVDFDLGMIDFVTLDPRLETSAGEVKGVSIQKLPGGNLARIGFHFVAGTLAEAEFRLWLESEGKEASEIWLYRWSA
jgi:glucans biosynthesis protein